MDIKRDEKYYQIAHNAIEGIEGHLAFDFLKSLCDEQSGIVVDVGCGEGSRLNYLLKGKNGIGIEINATALKLAKKNFPRFKYFLQKGSHIPLRDGVASISYSTFVLEHTSSPKEFIDEIVRITRPGGYLVIICPNFGAPNRRSPNSTENPILKLIYGFRNDFSKTTDLEWTKVVPKKEYLQIDDDTTVELYVLTLARYLKFRGLSQVKTSSLWDLEAKSLNPRKLLFLALGKLGIFPFKYWGPQVFVCFRKP